MTGILSRLTLRDFDALPETNVPTEVVDGVLVVSAMATPRHQLAAARLIVALHAALTTQPGLDVYGPAEWLLRRHPLLVRQPDVVVVPHAVAGTDQPRLTEPPLLAVEILSPLSVERDLVVKRREYLTAGLGHYWLVDLDTPAIVGFDASGQYAQADGDQPFTVEEPISFHLIPRELVA